MEVIKVKYPQKNEHYSLELCQQRNGDILTTLGTVFLEKGTRIPAEGFSRHPFNEVSIITKGCIEMISEEGTVLGYLTKGTAVYISAKEPQAGNVLEDTELIYVLNQKIEGD